MSQGKGKSKLVVNMSVLPGEKTDGSGRICIHLFVRDDAGPITEPHVLHPVIGEDGQPIEQRVTAKPARGKLACGAVMPKNKTTVRTDDPRAATCPKCMEQESYKAIMRQVTENK